MPRTVIAENSDGTDAPLRYIPLSRRKSARTKMRGKVQRDSPVLVLLAPSGEYD